MIKCECLRITARWALKTSVAPVCKGLEYLLMYLLMDLVLPMYSFLYQLFSPSCSNATSRTVLSLPSVPTRYRTLSGSRIQRM